MGIIITGIICYLWGHADGRQLGRWEGMNKMLSMAVGIAQVKDAER